MDSKKIEDSNEQKSGEGPVKKATAVDTGKRVDVSGVHLRSTTVRRRPHNDAAGRRPFKRDEAPKSAPEQTEETALAAEEPKPKPEAQVVSESAPKVPERRIPLYVEPTEFDETGDFAAMLAESEENAPGVALKIGDKVTGRVVHIGKENIFIALGPKIEAAIAASELSDADGRPKIHMGEKVTSYVISTFGGVTLSNNVAQSGLDSAMLEEARAKRIPVEGKVMAINKGGFDVQISGKRAFCPVGQIDAKFVEDTSAFIGRTLPFLIERIEEGGRNIVVSRRALLERERREKALETIKGLELNKKYDAVITRVADFGAFADIGGLEGLIPRSEISHGHIDRVSDVVSSGDRVEVVVLSFDINQDNPIKSKLAFSLKKTKDDPYSLHWSKIKSGVTLEGRVVRLESFGAFVELFPGIDGLIHISELSENRVAHPKEILSVGDPVSVRVVSVNEEDKRIGLSLRESVSKKKEGGAAAVSVKVERGQKASGVVSRIERYGVFVELDNGATALLPQSETGLPKNADLSRAFNIGDRIEVAIIDVDAQNRVRVSTLARKQMDERDSYLQFQTKETERGASFGTLADLLKKRG